MGRRNFREDIKLFIGLPKQPLLELSPPVLSTCLVLLIGGIRYIERIKGKDVKGNKNYFEFNTEGKISVNV